VGTVHSRLDEPASILVLQGRMLCCHSPECVSRQSAALYLSLCVLKKQVCLIGKRIIGMLALEAYKDAHCWAVTICESTTSLQHLRCTVHFAGYSTSCTGAATGALPGATQVNTQHWAPRLHTHTPGVDGGLLITETACGSISSSNPRHAIRMLSHSLNLVFTVDNLSSPFTKLAGTVPPVTQEQHSLA